MKILNMKIVTKIKLSFLIILIFSIMTNGILMYELKGSDSIIKNLYNTFIVTYNSLRAEKIISDFDLNLKAFITAVENRDEDAVSDLFFNKIRKDIKSSQEFLMSLSELIKDERWKEFMSEIDKSSKSWEETQKNLFSAVSSKDYDSILDITDGFNKDVGEILAGFQLMSLRAKDIADESNTVSQKAIARGLMVSGAISLLLILVAVLIAVFITKNISKSLSFFKSIFSKGASGDLNTRYPVKEKKRDELNELGKFFNNFIENVRRLISEVIDSSNEMGTSSEELSVTISNFSDNSQSQAASSEEITATMEEISAGVDNVSDNSNFQYTKLSEFISLMSELSGMINSMAGRITEAQDLSKGISKQAMAGNESLSLMDMIMKKITESSDRVSEIVTIIDDISDRINLLSLNAAIEAARAGEAGRGFAVVADEISKLADQTAVSISDIASLINKNKDEIAGGMQNVVNTIDNIGGVIEGVETINQMMTEIYSDMGNQKSTNDQVNSSVDDLKIRSEEVKNSSEEQKVAVSEVMKSITNINDLIQSSAAGAEEMRANANRLATMAVNLKNKIGYFKV